MLVVALVLAWISAPGLDSVAQRGAVELRWSAPADGCPDADAVLDDAMALLGGVVPAEPLRVTASVDERTGFVLALGIDGVDGGAVRSLEAARCEDVGRAAALLIAMAIDPTVVSRLPDTPAPEPEPSSLEVPKPQDPAVVTPASQPPPSPLRSEPRPPADEAPRSRRRVHASVSAGAGVGLFALPSATADLEFAFGLAVDRARVELGGSWWTPVDRGSSSNAAVSGRFNLGTAVARACFAPVWRTIELPLCAAVHAGLMTGRGTEGLALPQIARTPWLAIGGGPTLLWRPRRTGGRLGVWTRVEGTGVLLRPVFETAPSGLLWRAGAGGLGVAAGVELRFWSRP